MAGRARIVRDSSKEVAQKIQKAVEGQSGDIRLFLSDDFFQKHTKFGELDAFLAALPDIGDLGEVTTVDQFNTQEVDEVVRANSGFSTVQQMLGKAVEERLVRELGIKPTRIDGDV